MCIYIPICIYVISLNIVIKSIQLNKLTSRFCKLKPEVARYIRQGFNQAFNVFLSFSN